MRLILLIFFAFLFSCNREGKNSNIKNGFAKVNGTNLYYEMVGEGQPIVFVHGNFGDRRHWDNQFKALSKKHTVMRYDLRGYGKSALPMSDEPYKDCDDLKALLAFLKIEKANICGVSAGSSIAIDFVLTYPELCNSLIAIGPWIGGYGFNEYKTPASDSLFAIFSRVIKVLEKDGARAATEYWWTGNHSVKNSVRSPNTLDSLLKMGYEYSYWGFLNKSKMKSLSPPAIKRLKEITVPTLIITAEYDIEACKENAEILATEINHAEKVSINDAGHLMNMDKPDEFNKIIVEFIETPR